MGSPETCPTCGSDDVLDRRMAPWALDLSDEMNPKTITKLCRNAWHDTPTPPAPADDAGGAEAMAWPYNVACGHCGHHPNQHAANGCEAVCHNPEDNPDECGCRETFARLPLPARDDAVVEARCKVVEAARVLRGRIHETPYSRAREFAALQDVEDAVDALLAAENAALRGKGGA